MKKGLVSEATIIPSNEIKEDEEPSNDQVPSVEDNTEDEFESDEAKQMEKDETPEKIDGENETDRIKDIQDLTTDKMREFEQTLETIKNEILDFRYKTVDIDNIKTNLNILNAKVDDITPPTPEESLTKMANIAGGFTIQQYWADYLAKNKPYETVVPNGTILNGITDINIDVNNPKNGNNTDFNIKKGDDRDGDTVYIMNIKDVENYDEDTIKNSILGKNIDSNDQNRKTRF